MGIPDHFQSREKVFSEPFLTRRTHRFNAGFQAALTPTPGFDRPDKRLDKLLDPAA